MRPVFRLLPLFALFCTTAASAHGDVECTAPKAEWRRSVDLQAKLKKDGWKVRRIQVFNGCYEVYGFDERDQRVEAFFDPKTFERVQ